MAVTQYQIFCRYLNETVNRALTNQTPIAWISADEMTQLKEFYAEHQSEYEDLKAQILNGDIRVNQFSVQQLNIYTMGQRYDEVQDLIKKEKIAIEQCILEPCDSLYQDTNNQKKKAQAQRDLDLYTIVIDETTAMNPKYDMVFMYDGIAYAESRTGKADYNPPQNDDKQVPYLYYERMKRVQLDPWFLFSTHASLNSAMVKARELVNILGKDAVKIGKVVPLDQYIEIV
jgi:hypothetical protein